ncbi:MAG: uroporphyrin-III C-methyltransferase / precorrin-2 dehydrogenase / sirohydrochlorin [Beijerinckiaceae bacterium]|nr:MAG: uroporphyrin-III C-methyltransferase / precorrin-2 dehydrogenase / sirohydrochlorin [Beijerinckiaceae bacterium]
MIRASRPLSDLRKPEDSRKPKETGPHRLGMLAKLPVFFDLRGKRVVLAGGSAGAAWKAELLAACGAFVEIYAEAVNDEMSALIARGAADGALVLHQRPWSIDVFAGAAMAVGDVEDHAEAKAFRCAAKAAGVPVNTVDKPETCDFQFGSIVNRSPVVIGISTDGAAPILGQAIRRRIEMLIPPTLAHWADRAQAIRERIMRVLKPGPERRTFWERFSEAAFRDRMDSKSDAAIDRLITESRTGLATARGRVTLVGAGPGDAELLTIKAVRALQSADVILFDDLVSDAVLELARREARRMMVGKRGSRESCSQSDINALMLKLAGQGKHVVRLKSGDPMVFGRAGEEIAALEAAGVPVAVVPGVTSAQAMAATVNRSLTHRDHAQSLTLLTGHSRKGEVPETIDWARAGAPNATLVIYMGARQATGIRARLLAEGLARHTPACAIASISRPEEQRWSGTLDALVEGVAILPEGAPVLIGIGTVFADLAPCAAGTLTAAS